MSQQGLARRSASHGALSSSYAAQGHANSESGHQMPSFRPLRSIREHTHAYLDPAASVDGMLRKTTETGNIGVFSINNTRSHHQLYSKPNKLRARASLNDLRPPPRPFSRNSDRHPNQDDRRHLPSYRDSTSEIISMYGSENHSSKSLSSSLTTPCDDLGQRSYSMTTCGSRGYFMSRSNGAQQSEEFQGRGQRPRSPYPYPTRLPRPGIRPSSPALTENGVIDYRKMVAINRVSHVSRPRFTTILKLVRLLTSTENDAPSLQDLVSLQDDKRPIATLPETRRQRVYALFLRGPCCTSSLCISTSVPAATAQPSP